MERRSGKQCIGYGAGSSCLGVGAYTVTHHSACQWASELGRVQQRRSRKSSRLGGVCYRGGKGCQPHSRRTARCSSIQGLAAISRKCFCNSRARLGAFIGRHCASQLGLVIETGSLEARVHRDSSGRECGQSPRLTESSLISANLTTASIRGEPERSAKRRVTGLGPASTMD